MSKFNVPYNDAIKRDDKSKINCKTKTKTHQSFKDECDINNIIRKYDATGLLTHVKTAQGVYSDVSNITDYQEALEAVITAQAAFDELPSKIKKRFGHSPAAFLEFVGNPENLPEMISLGLAVETPPASGAVSSSGETEGSQGVA